MAYVITRRCVGTCDTACVDVCPCDCIHGPIPLDALRAVAADQRGARFPAVQMFIEPDACVDCDACAQECPVDAIVHETDVPEEYAGDIARNREFFAGPEPAG